MTLQKGFDQSVAIDFLSIKLCFEKQHQKEIELFFFGDLIDIYSNIYWAHYFYKDWQQ